MAKACAYLCRQCCFIDGFGEFGVRVAAYSQRFVVLLVCAGYFEDFCISFISLPLLQIAALTRPNILQRHCGLMQAMQAYVISRLKITVSSCGCDYLRIRCQATAWNCEACPVTCQRMRNAYVLPVVFVSSASPRWYEHSTCLTFQPWH